MRAWFAVRNRRALGIGLLLLTSIWSCSADQSGGGMPRTQVVLGGETFTAEIADTPSLQARGLSGRSHLGAEEGMLFLYSDRGRHTFWMKDMLISIDMLWLDNTRIVHIEHQVPPPAPGTPDSELPTYASTAPANSVLEIAAGRVAGLGVRVGDAVRFVFN